MAIIIEVSCPSLVKIACVVLSITTLTLTLTIWTQLIDKQNVLRYKCVILPNATKWAQFNKLGEEFKGEHGSYPTGFQEDLDIYQARVKSSGPENLDSLYLPVYQGLAIMETLSWLVVVIVPTLHCINLVRLLEKVPRTDTGALDKKYLKIEAYFWGPIYSGCIVACVMCLYLKSNEVKYDDGLGESQWEVTGQKFGSKYLWNPSLNVKACLDLFEKAGNIQNSLFMLLILLAPFGGVALLGNFMAPSMLN